MEPKYYLYCLADFTLITTSLIYGIKLLKKRNFLLGFEWLVVTFSATNLLTNALTGEQVFLSISLFCDAFSRTVGVPVIAVAGMMAVTHRYKPSTGADVMYVVGGLAATVVVWTADFMVGPKPYFYLVMWSLFSVLRRLRDQEIAKRRREADRFRRDPGVGIRTDDCQHL
ncbi:hypothetical protein [Ralstonia sp. GP71]|uniref:hypothetical protein n=1 Tax=Ralstonia sp. GP71 TaxID=3035152 RepID=UPI0038924064